jgi:DNA-binding transcriptional regulator YiaG
MQDGRMEKTSRIALAQHIKAEKMKKKDFAAMLGVSASQLSRWLSGTVVPDRLSRKFVEFATRQIVSADGWR